MLDLFDRLENWFLREAPEWVLYALPVIGTAVTFTALAAAMGLFK
jgi:hypothetical protein